MKKLSKLLLVLGFLLSTGATFLIAKPADAAQNGTPDCAERYYNRCLLAGYLTGGTSIEPSPNMGDNIIFPLGNYYNYTDTWLGAPSGTLWSFPQVTGSSTKNAAYAKTFVNLLDSYLNPSQAWQTCTTNVNSHNNPITSGGFSSGSTCFKLRRDAIGAAMIVNTILGKNGSDFGNGQFGTNAYNVAIQNGVTYAQNNIGRLRSIILQYDAAGLIDWNYADHALGLPTTHINSTGINWGTDVQLFRDPDDYLFNAIRIRNGAGTVLYELNRSCGNIINDVGAVPPLDDFDLKPVANLVTIGPNDNDATYTENPDEAKLTLRIQQLTTPTVIKGVEWEAQFYARRYISNGVFGQNINLNCSGSMQGKINLPAAVVKTVKVCDDTDILTLKLKAGDEICGFLTINPGSGQVDGSGNITSSDAAKGPVGSCQIIRDLPYLKFYGGDVYSGGGFNDDSGFGCATIGHINTWNNSDDPKNSGSSAQFAATALGNIKQFTSANLGGGGQASPPNGLTFANTPSDGSFDRGQCITDYWTNGLGLPNNTGPSVNTDNTLTSGEHKTGGDVIINPVGDSELGNGIHYVLYVDGDARIAHNIKYSALFKTSGLVNESDIPLFILIAKGNIYIDPAVDELNGIFIAQGYHDINKGNIYTCSDGFQAYPTPDTSTNAEPFLDSSKCRSHLAVYGTFVARKVYFNRTGGSLRDSVANERYTMAPNKAAETFVISPEMYVGADGLCGSVPIVCNKGGYDAITGLPPVL